MRKNKRIFAALLALTMAMTAAAGCGKKGGGNTATPGLDVSLEHSYKSVQVGGDSLYYSEKFVPMGDKVFIKGTDEFAEGDYAVYDTASGSCSKVELNYVKSAPKDVIISCADAYWDSSSSQLNVLFTGTDASGSALDPTIETYDANMQFVAAHPLSDILAKDCTPTGITLNPAGGFYMVVQNQADSSFLIYTVDSSYKKVNEIQTNAAYTSSFFTSKDAAYIYTMDSNGPQMFRIDGTSLTPVTIKGLSPYITGSYFPSSDSRYDFYVYDSYDMYGINIASGTTEPVLNWVNSDFVSTDVNGAIAQLGDGRFLVNCFTNGYGTPANTWVLSERPAEEFKNTTLLSMSGFYIDSSVTRAVLNYNRTHSDTRIAILDYAKYVSTDDSGETSNTMDKAMDKMKNDLTNGIVADFTCTNNTPFESLCNKGIFADLTDYCSQLSSDEYFTNVLQSLQYDGKQYQICASYTLETLMGKKEMIGDKEGIGFDELMNLINSAGSDVKPFGMKQRDSMIKYLIGQTLNSFIDTKTGTCNFNTPEFISMLEFAKTLPSEIDIANIDWNEEMMIYINNKGLLYSATLIDFANSYSLQHMQFDDAEVCYLGYPVSAAGGNGTLIQPTSPIALSANTQNKEKCLDFFNYLLSYDYQSTFNNGFPVNRKAMDKVKEDALKPKMEKDENGKLVEAQPTAYIGGVMTKIAPMTSAYTDRIENLILGAKVAVYTNSQVISILEEEANTFFNGDQDAAKTAESIQNRVSLYLSEQMK